jgi:transcriptional regulator with XRE-family HTH domain
MITPGQCRAARGLLDWSQQQLAKIAGVGLVTVHQLENGSSKPRKATLEVIRLAFEASGIEFIDENGADLACAFASGAKKSDANERAHALSVNIPELKDRLFIS